MFVFLSFTRKISVNMMMSIALRALISPMVVEIEPITPARGVMPKTPAKRSSIELKDRIKRYLGYIKDLLPDNPLGELLNPRR